MQDKDLLLFLMAKTNWTIHDFNNEFARIDSYLTDENGVLAGFLERKTRNVPMNEYDTAIIDFQKYQAMQYLEAATGLKCWLAYGWSDGLIAVVQPTRCPIKVEMVTPSEKSVSFNAGVSREVAHIEVRRFEILGTVA